mmetsp:Transcript_9088/g.20841  ORF Transcript_9088/g.20841 Transcript_9088/m.20841 type:complete len:84 (+) Transcript_9088:1332-1583(+)
MPITGESTIEIKKWNGLIQIKKLGESYERMIGQKLVAFWNNTLQQACKDCQKVGVTGGVMKRSKRNFSAQISGMRLRIKQQLA